MGLYVLDWDGYGGGRSEQIEVINADTNQVLDTETVSGFQGGEYLTWSLSGNIEFQVTNLNSSSNAVVSGLFFGANLPTTPGGTADYAGSDTAMQGNWQGVYGADGYDLSQGAASLPSYATVNVSGNSNYTWTGSSSDPRALEQPGTSDRLAACWFSSSDFNIQVDLTDGQTHPIALYALDWDGYGGGRSEQVNVFDAVTGKLLDSEAISGFQGGEYLVWNVSGDVVFQVVNLNSSSNAVINGLFFGASVGVVQGTAFDDLTGSGQRQSTDPGLAGWTVNLLTGGNVIATTTTNSSGGYSFLNLCPAITACRKCCHRAIPKRRFPATRLPSWQGSMPSLTSATSRTRPSPAPSSTTPMQTGSSKSPSWASPGPRWSSTRNRRRGLEQPGPDDDHRQQRQLQLHRPGAFGGGDFLRRRPGGAGWNEPNEAHVPKRCHYPARRPHRLAGAGHRRGRCQPDRPARPADQRHRQLHAEPAQQFHHGNGQLQQRRRQLRQHQYLSQPVQRHLQQRRQLRR